jgi:hypothetical protein
VPSQGDHCFKKIKSFLHRQWSRMAHCPPVQRLWRYSMVPSYLQIQVAILVIWHGEVLDMNMVNLPVLHKGCTRGAVLRGGRVAQVEMRCAVNRKKSWLKAYRRHHSQSTLDLNKAVRGPRDRLANKRRSQETRRRACVRAGERQLLPAQA